MPGIPRVYIRSDINVNDSQASVRNEIDTLANEERTERQKMIEKARRYFDGDHDIPLKVETGEKDDNIILNVSGQSIDKTTDFVGVPVLSIGNDEAGTLTDELKKVVEHIEMEFLFPDLLESGQLGGHGFLRIIPQEGDISIDNLPLLAVIPPEYVTVMWDKSMYGMKQGSLWYRLEWEFADIMRRQDIVPANMVSDEDGNINEKAEGWLILEYEKRKNNRSGDDSWQLIAVDEWTYPFSPIIDGKNRRNSNHYYGKSDLQSTRLNDAINFTASNVGRILKTHAHPKTVLFGNDGSGLTGTRVDGLWAIPDENVDIKNLEMQSDLESSMKFLDMLRSSYFTQRRVIDMTSQKDRSGQLTNFSVRMLFNDMIEMADDKRNRYGKIVKTAIERIFAMIGYSVTIVIKWDDPLPVNRLEVVQTAQAEIDMGVSKTTVFKDLNRDYEAEVENVAEESANSATITANRFFREAQLGAVN